MTIARALRAHPIHRVTKNMLRLPMLPMLPMLVCLACLNLPAIATASTCTYGEDFSKSALRELCPFDDGLARFLIDGKWGVIDRVGKIVIEPRFDALEYFRDGVAAAELDGKWGVIDKQGQWVVQPRFDEVRRFSGGLALAREAGKWGYIDPAGKWVITPRFENADSFDGTVAIVNDGHGNSSMIDRTGRVVKRFSPEVNVNSLGSANGLFMASVKSPTVLRNLDGRTAAYPSDTTEALYKDQHFVATKQIKPGDASSARAGLLDMAGNWVFAPRFAKLQPFNGKLAVASPAEGVNRGQRAGLIDKKGNFVVQPMYASIEGAQWGRFAAAHPGAEKLDYLDENGKLLLTIACGELLESPITGKWIKASGCGKTWILHAARGLVSSYADERSVSSSGEHIMIERTGSEENDYVTTFDIHDGTGKRVLGQEALPGAFNSVAFVTPPSATLPLAYAEQVRGKTVLISHAYEVISRPDWDSESELSNYSRDGDAKAQEGPLVLKGAKGFGAVDVKGNWVIAPTFTRLTAFRHGLAIGQESSDDPQVLVDAGGKVHPFPQHARHVERVAHMVVEGRHDDSRDTIVRYDASSGVVSSRPDVASRYSGDAVEGLAPAEKDGKHGLMDGKGAWVVKPAFAARITPVMHDKRLLGWITENKQGLKGWLGARGKELVTPRFGEIALNEASGVLMVTEESDLDGVMTPDGKLAIGPMRADISALGDGWFVVKEHEKHGLVNAQGEWKTRPGHVPLSLDRPYAVVKENTGTQLVDHDGRVSTRAAPKELLQGEEKSDTWWQAVEADADGKKTTIFYGFNFKERMRVPGEATLAAFSEGVMPFTPSDKKLEGKTGLANDQGKVIGMFQYGDVEPMQEGLAVAQGPRKIGGKWSFAYGYIDRSGKVVVPFSFDKAFSFYQQRATVVADGNLALIDTGGKFLLKSAWFCGRTPVILDGNKNIVWPKGLQLTDKCKK